MGKSAVLSLLVLAVEKVICQNCSSTFKPVTAAAAFVALNPGWNLGNTLDTTPDEGSWNNPPVQPITFSQVKAKGFKSVRVPGMFSIL